MGSRRSGLWIISVVLLAVCGTTCASQTPLRFGACTHESKNITFEHRYAKANQTLIGASRQFLTFSTHSGTELRREERPAPCLAESKTGFLDPVTAYSERHSAGGSSASQAQTPANDAHELAKKLSNPVASLISLPFQSNLDTRMGNRDGWRYTLNIQPVIPFALSPKWNLISRTIIPIIHQSKVVNNGSQTGLGDITQSFFFSPNKSEPFIWGAGPALLIPTATNDALGTEKFAIGPTLLVLKQQGGWTYGALTNHLWSVAGASDRANVNSTFIQPFLAYNTNDAWTYTINSESSYDWNGNQWSVPIHFTISKLLKVGQQPLSIGGGFRCWATSPPGGPRLCGARFIVTPLFPKK